MKRPKFSAEQIGFLREAFALECVHEGRSAITAREVEMLGPFTTALIATTATQSAAYMRGMRLLHLKPRQTQAARGCEWCKFKRTVGQRKQSC